MTRKQAAAFWESASDHAKREIRDFTLFKESGGKILRNPDLNRESKVKLIETAGNMNLVTPDRLVSGTDSRIRQVGQLFIPAWDKKG